MGAVLLACAVLIVPGPGTAREPVPAPSWLVLQPGTTARVDVAPWPVYDEPEAALTASVASLERDFTADLARPNDIVYEPIGVRVRVIRLVPGTAIALVRGLTSGWEGYVPLDRLAPDIPRGTRLRAAGGFEGFSDFFPHLDTPLIRAAGLPTGTDLRVLDMGVAPYDPQQDGFVRVKVLVLDGPAHGRTGWVSVGYAGVPSLRLPADAEAAEKACSCRLVRFSQTAAERRTQRRGS